MLIFWSLVRNSVVLAVYLLFSVACFLTVHEHYLLGKRVQFGDAAGRNPGSGPRFPPPSLRLRVGGLVVIEPLFEPAIGPFAAEVAYAEAPNLRALAGAGVPDLGAPLDFPVDGGCREPDPLGDRRRGFALRDASLYQHSVVHR